MSILARASALVLALCPVLLGCQPGTPEEPGDEHVLSAGEADRIGVHTHNGLDPLVYHSYEGRLLQTTNYKLVNDPSTGSLDPEIAAILLTTPQGLPDPQGVEVFTYAMRCALPLDPKYNKVSWQGTPYYGDGIVASDQIWRTEPLTQTARYELFACMAAHLNPYGLVVDLEMSGPDTIPDLTYDFKEFTIDEALWVALPAVDGSVNYVVYPLQPFATKCATDPFEALKKRVCGQNPSGMDCHLSQGNIKDCVFDEKTGDAVCLGQPALKTTLRESDVGVLNPSCQ